ncbi:MAG TPA: PQQ-dependent sugar dehydrogenase, partial [Chthoniobacteraceae bacterium]|nr:PQQ-dependent sugar dehydrogenase [Chthoniobacteraceae bacterium]
MNTTLVQLVRCGLAAAAIAGMVRSPSSTAATFAPGFAESTYSAGWNEPVGIIFGRNPDGSKERMYVWERTGRVWIVEDGVRLAAPLLDISDEVAGYRDHGMLGFALDPDFTTNGRFYVMYVVDRHHLLNYGTPAYNPTTNEYFMPTIGRITRYTARVSDDRRTADPATRLVLVGETKSTGFPVLHESHSIGSLFFGRDGTLLATCGDGASYNAMDNGRQAGGAYGDAAVTDGIIDAAQNIGAFRSQLLDSLSGKMIRIDPSTGDGVPGNPLFQSGTPRSVRSRMWARGLRNPCRFTLRPGTGSTVPADANPGAFFIGDVGWNTKEDLHVADVGGRNFGWPLFEGMDQQPAYWAARPTGMNGTDHTRPLADWRNGSTARVSVGGTIYNMGAVGNPVSGTSFGGNCSIGGCWYQGADFPPDYAGTYFHADYGGGWIRNFQIGANNEIEAIRTFASSTGGVMFVTTHPENGGIYYIPFGGQIMKVEYVGGTPPIARGGAHRTWGTSPLTVNFSSLGSVDPKGGALRFLWDFGDGVTSTLPYPSHTY